MTDGRPRGRCRALGWYAEDDRLDREVGACLRVETWWGDGRQDEASTCKGEGGMRWPGHLSIPLQR